MIESERDMVRKPAQTEKSADRFTSLQPTYEDTVQPDTDDWELEHSDHGEG